MERLQSRCWPLTLQKSHLEQPRITGVKKRCYCNQFVAKSARDESSDSVNIFSGSATRSEAFVYFSIEFFSNKLFDDVDNFVVCRFISFCFVFCFQFFCLPWDLLFTVWCRPVCLEYKLISFSFLEHLCFSMCPWKSLEVMFISSFENCFQQHSANRWNSNS